VRGFLRYFCFYCASRLLFNGARAALRARPAPAPCKHHLRGVAFTLFVILPFAAFVFLAVVGFWQQP